MLLQFRFQNFKCFRDDTILDMTAAPHVTEHPDHVVELGEERVLPAAAIYGANASGKSKVVEALAAMAVYAWASDRSLLQTFAFPSFLFDLDSQNTPSTLEVYFTNPEEQDAVVWNYGFSTGDSGIIVEEWLNEKDTGDTEFHCVFYREGMELDMPGIAEKWQENLRVSLSQNDLLISLGAFLQVKPLSRIVRWFQTFSFSIDVASDERSLRILAGLMKEHEPIRRDVVKYLSAFDPSIVDFQIDRIPKADRNGDTFLIWAMHRIAGSDGFRKVLLSEESDGTQKALSLYLPLLTNLSTGGIVVIDELNAKLHPLLVQNILLMFLNPETNPKHAQILFTTHDVWQLTSGILRRDEIWFTQKNPDGACTLYSRSDFIDGDGDHFLREDMAEAYLTGEYGAIPHLRPLFRNADQAGAEDSEEEAAEETGEEGSGGETREDNEEETREEDNGGDTTENGTTGEA